MAFLAEDGTGLALANGYIDIAFADTYLTDRGMTAWMFSDTLGTVAVTAAEKQSAIIRATDHVDRVFGDIFKGSKKSGAQALAWPRSNALDSEGRALRDIPDKLKAAVAEYSIRALLYGILTPDPPPKGPRQNLAQGGDISIYGEGEGEIKLVRQKVGPIEEEVRYNDKTAGSLARHPAADMLLRGLTRSKATTIIRG